MPNRIGFSVKKSGSIAAAALVAAFMVTIAFGLGIPETYGFSFGWGWRGVNSGRTEVRAVTPKIRDVRVRGIYMAEGEQLLAIYDFRLETGRARVEVLRRGWIPRPRGVLVVHRNIDIRHPIRQELRPAARGVASIRSPA